MTKDEKIFKKFAKKLSFILNDQYLAPLIKNHFNKNGSFALFIIALLENRVGTEKVLNNLHINLDEWSNLFSSLYGDKTIVDTFNNLSINPAITIEQINNAFSCFDNFVNKFIRFLKDHNINLNISEEQLISLLKNALGYLLYNCVDNKIDYHFKDILIDNEYDGKYLTILNNTRLFAKVKNDILSCCGTNINDLIVLLLGMSKQLNLDK